MFMEIRVDGDDSCRQSRDIHKFDMTNNYIKNINLNSILLNMQYIL